ncbi:hypothetical protein C9J22_20575 [Photobacterium phosphoreum]|uniref:hypothetical protein n=1 Tax=Photobacterium phosphoreum TaxID=659 RepID=UPI000D152CDB|nr:hypothetical protein [Photobacterium phosphoreum]PSU66825.1 hypothetical protein C9J22_20575 [Photobacterium phosphoreum]
MVKNKLSKLQVIEIRKLTGLLDDDLTNLIKNTEFQLDDLGELPVNESGDIDLTIKYSNLLDMRNLLDEISQEAKKLNKLIARFNAKTDKKLSVGANSLGVPPFRKDKNGTEWFNDILSDVYIDCLISKVEDDSEYYSICVKAKSQKVTEVLYHCWSFALPPSMFQPIKNSPKDMFVNFVSIVTGWDTDLSRKNITGAKWYKKTKTNAQS